MQSDVIVEDLGRRRIVHLRSISGLGGGPEKTIWKSLRSYETFGYTGTAIYLHCPRSKDIDTLRKKYQELKLDFVSIPDNGPLDFSLVGKILHVLKIRGGDVLQVHDDKSLFLGTIVSMISGMPLVSMNHGWTSRGHNVFRRLFYRKIAGMCLRRADRCIPVSKDIEEELITLGVRPKRIRRIENGIDSEEYSKKRSLNLNLKRRQLAFAEPVFLIGGLGRLAREKGFDRLVHMIKRLRDKGFNVALVLGGEGYFREDLVVLVKSLGVKDYVRLLGYVSDPREFFDMIDLFFLSSQAEGLPNVVLEAMAMEVPVVSTRVRGVLELVENKRTGLLVDFESPEDWDKVIIEQMADRALGSRIAEQARLLVEKQYSFRTRMEKVIAVYEDLVGNRMNVVMSRE